MVIPLPPRLELTYAPIGLIPMLLSLVISKFGNRLYMQRLVTFNFIMYAVCFYWHTYTFEPRIDFGASAWPQFFQGFAIAYFFMPFNHHCVTRLIGRTYSGGIKAVEFYPYSGRLYRYFDHHHVVDSARISALFSANGVYKPL